jgi:hypothetical protein
MRYQVKIHTISKLPRKNILQILPKFFYFFFVEKKNKQKNNKEMLMEKEMTSIPSM